MVSAGNSLATILAKKGSIAIIVMPNDKIATATPPAWAVGELKKALEKQGSKVRIAKNISNATQNEYVILVSGMNTPLAKSAFKKLAITSPDVAESLCIVQTEIDNKTVLLTSGFDERGLVYVITELADRVTLVESDKDALNLRFRLLKKQPVAYEVYYAIFLQNWKINPGFTIVNIG